MDDMQDEPSWLRGGGGVSGWQSRDLQPRPLHQQLHEPDPFDEMCEWGNGGVEGASMLSPPSSWQSSMHEHDSTFPSAYPPFSDTLTSLSSPSHLLSSATALSYTASSSRHGMAASHPLQHIVPVASLPADVATAAPGSDWSRRTSAPALSELASPRLSLASTVGSSSASSTLSSTPSSVSSSSPASPLVLSQRHAARKPDAIHIPSFIPPASLPTSLPGAPHVFSSSSPVGSSYGAAGSSGYQSRDMTSGTPIFSSSSMSPPTVQPRQLLPRPPQPHSHTQPQPQSQYTDAISPSDAAASASPHPDHAPSPTIAFRSMSIAPASAVSAPDLLSHSQPLHSYSGKERKQTSIRANRKLVETYPMTAIQRLRPGDQPMTVAAASVVAVPAVPSSHTPPGSSKSKSSRKLRVSVMIDVPVKPSLASAAAVSGGLPGLTPPKSKRSVSKAGVFSSHPFAASPPSPNLPFPAPVVATISPLTEQRTMRATGVTVASPVKVSSRLLSHLNDPTSPPVTAPIVPYSSYSSPHVQQSHNASTAVARVMSPFDDDISSLATQQLQRHQHHHSFHSKQREEYKSNDDAQVMHTPAHFTSNHQPRFAPPDDLSQPSTPYSPGPSAHDPHTRSTIHSGDSHSQTPQSAWTRQYSAPAAAPSYNHPPNETVRQLGRPERGSFAAPQQQQPNMARSVSSNQDRSYGAADSSPSAPWTETQPVDRMRHNQPTTPLDDSPYPDGSSAFHSSHPPQRAAYFDKKASSAALSTLAAKFTEMQRATSAPPQPPMPQPQKYGSRQRSESDSRSTAVDGQRTSSGQHPHPLLHHTPALLAQRQQQLLEHFKQSNPTLRALSPEATAFLAALLGAEQAQHVAAHSAHSMQSNAATHNTAINSHSRPPSSTSAATHQPLSCHQQPPNGAMPPLSEKQLQQLQQHLSLQQRHLQQKLAQQFQHQASRPTSTLSSSGQQKFDGRPSSLPHSSSQQSARPASSGSLTPCPMSSAGCELRFRSANEMQAHYLACHM